MLTGDPFSDNGTGAYPLTTDYITKNLKTLLPLLGPLSKPAAETLQVRLLLCGTRPVVVAHVLVCPADDFASSALPLLSF